MYWKVFGRIKEWKWGTSRKSMWVQNPWNTTHIPYILNYPELYFLLKVQITQKLKKRTTGLQKMDAFGKEYYSWMFVKSVMVCLDKRKCLMEKLYLKRILKRLWHCKWKTWCKLLPNWGLKKLCAHFYHTPSTIFIVRNIMHKKQCCAAIL